MEVEECDNFDDEENYELNEEILSTNDENEGERQELVARLETGARHYRKLAAEKSAVERSSEQREELLKSRVAQLERQLAGLHIEVTHLKTVFFFYVQCSASNVLHCGNIPVTYI